MRARLGVAITTGICAATATVVHAETAVRVQNCREAEAALRAHALSPSAPAPPTSRCWDFEQGTLADTYFGPWTLEQPSPTHAFNSQPTYGDNVRLDRVETASPLRTAVNSIGGDYWNTPYPIGHQGRYWLGTYENRRSSAQPWNTLQYDPPTGTIVSPSFTLDRDYVHFLIGGGCDLESVYVELQVFDEATKKWVAAVDAAGKRLRATGRCSELLERKVFNTGNGTGFGGASRGLRGRSARIRIQDGASGAWGHINVDHVVHTSTPPTDVDGANRPVWGFADTHAHPGSHLAFQGLGTDGAGRLLDGHAFHGGPGLDFGSALSSMYRDLAWCYPKDWPRAGKADGHPSIHNTDLHQASEMVVKTLGGASLGFQFHDRRGFSGDASGDFLGWPYWWSRGHQQMHVKWLRRAFDGGQRLMVAAQHNNALMGAMMRENSAHPHLSDYGALRLFARFMRQLADANRDWMQIALTPHQARQIIRSNKLAVVLATEVDSLGDHCEGDFSEDAETSGSDRAYSRSTCENCNPWPFVLDHGRAKRCGDPDVAGWTRRVEALYAAGYRVLTPIHLTDSELGGTAVYSDLFNVANKYVHDRYLDVDVSPDVSFRLSSDSQKPVWCQAAGCADATALPFWDRFLIGIAGWAVAWDAYTPAAQTVAVPEYEGEGSDGHVNRKGLWNMGQLVLEQMKRRGMIIDVTHMSQYARDRVLGLGRFRTRSIVASTPDCDMGTAACQAGAYPAISSHAPFRKLAKDGRGAESGLRHEEVLRIRDIGGMVGPGTGGAGDVRHVDEAFPVYPPPGSPLPPLYEATVANDCAGSSRSYAQNYLYALRAMSGRGVGINTDMGLEGQPNPRFGSMGCYARGNIPLARYHDTKGGRVVDFTEPPINAVPALTGAITFAAGWDPILPNVAAASEPTGTAGLQRAAQRSRSGLNYMHYAGRPPRWDGVANSPTSKFQGLWEYPSWRAAVRAGPITRPSSEYVYSSPASMDVLSTQPALRADVTGDRTFDLNYDGFAHYGMYPDFLQDLRAVGVTTEQLGVLFSSAEDFIRTWEKACALSDRAVSRLGC